MSADRLAFPMYQQAWDVQLVLDYLSEIHPVSDLSLKDLTLSLVMLIALVIGQRGQSSHLINTAHMQAEKASYQFVLSEKVKQYSKKIPTSTGLARFSSAAKAMCSFRSEGILQKKRKSRETLHCL